MKEKNKNIIIAASGTGGHIYPGISLALEMKQRGYNPVFFLSDNKASAEIIKNSGFEHVSFNMSGMPPKFSFSFIKFLFKLGISFFKAAVFIIKLNPAAVVGMGGYVAVPAVFAARTLRKKTFIHEQNTVPGKANKLLNGVAGETFISFKDSEIYFKKQNILLTGYPIRKDILNVSRKEGCERLKLDEKVFTVLIFGGSLGAAKLNEIANDAMVLLAEQDKIQVVHITGQQGYAVIKERAKDRGFCMLYDYMHDIKYAYAASDIVICRSGAGTVFELKALNKSAVLVPFPYATDNHQFFNAKAIEEEGVIEVIEEKDLTVEKLFETVKRLKVLAKLKPSEKIEKLPQETIAEEIIKNIG